MSGEAMARWTVDLAMAAYVAAVLIELSTGKRGAAGWKPVVSGNEARQDGEARSRSFHADFVWRLCWTAGCLLLWLHVGLAFHVHHGWSHAAAYAHTAQRTFELVGIDTGSGIYWNYLLMGWWGGDVLWLWGDRRSYETRSPAWKMLLHAYLGFLAVQATIVFETGLIRWAGLAALCVVAVVWACRRPARQAESSVRS